MTAPSTAEARPEADASPRELERLLTRAGRGAPTAEADATLTGLARLTRLDRVARTSPRAASAPALVPQPRSESLAPWPIAGRLRRLARAAEETYGVAAADRLRRAIARVCAQHKTRLGPIELGRSPDDPDGATRRSPATPNPSLLAAFEWVTRTRPLPGRRLAIRKLAGREARNTAELLAAGDPEQLCVALGVSIAALIAATERADATRAGPAWLSALRIALTASSGASDATVAAFVAGRGAVARANDLRASAGAMKRRWRAILAATLLPHFEAAALWEVVRRDAVFGALPDEAAQKLWEAAPDAPPKDLWLLAVSTSPSFARRAVELAATEPLLQDVLGLLVDADARLAGTVK